MEKIYGTKQRQDCLVRTGRSKWILFFGFWKDDEKSESGWEYRHTFNRKPTLSEVKEIVVSAINKTTEEKIINGFVWNKKPIYLSPENQLNFSAIERSENIPYPLTLKINEQEDGTPIYHTFENADDFIAFSQSVCAYVIKTVQDGWREKDSVDWTMFNLK
ncbi:hypothetical protein ACMSF4_01440 [Bacteroides thetaiotaomicron]|jgi:hypothetical protein|uniref:hypothetical protein n=1 Tax=Bacteroides thetaiotaomicron TaxID=818 RepID=UPI0039C235D0